MTIYCNFDFKKSIIKFYILTSSLVLSLLSIYAKSEQQTHHTNEADSLSQWLQDFKESAHIDHIRSRILRHNTLPNNHNLPVDVSVKLVFESVREIGIDATIDFYVEFIWRDERETNDIYISGADSRDYAWTPDVYFLLSRHTDYSRTSQYMIIENRTVLFDQKVTVTLPCIPNAFMYPFDTMYCSIVLSSYGYSNDKINLHWASGKSIVFPREYHDIEYTGFSMLLNKTNQTTYDAFYDPYTYTILEGQIYFKRLYAVYVYQLFLPAVFLVGLSWITFWINPHATPARAAIGVTTILTMLTLNTNRQQDRNSKYLNIKMSLLDIYLWTSFIYVILAMVVFSASDYTLAAKNRAPPPPHPHNQHHKHHQMKNPNSHRCSAYVSPNGAACYNGSLPSHNSGSNSRKWWDKYGLGVIRKLFFGKSIDYYARLFFPLTFGLFNLAFWCYAFTMS